MICPQSLTGSLGDVSVNGVVESYPDDCIVLDSTFVPDRVFVLRAKANAPYYVRKKSCTDAKDIDVNALAQKGVQFEQPELVCANRIRKRPFHSLRAGEADGRPGRLHLFGKGCDT